MEHSKQELACLCDRVQALEARSRRRGIVLLFLANACGLAFLSSAFRGDDDIRTRNLVILDDNDAARATFFVGEDGDVRLSLLDTEGLARIILAASAEKGARVSLTDDGEKPRVLLSTNPMGSQVLLGNPDASHLGLLMNQDGPSLSLVDEQELWMHSNSMTLRDRNALARGAFWLLDDGQPALFLGDDAGRRRAQLALSSEGEPIMTLLDHEDRARVRLGVTAHGSAFSLYDQEENSAFSVTESTLETTLLKARKLEIVDEGGRADLGAGEQGPGLALSDPNGDRRVGLLLDPGGGFLSIRAGGGQEGVFLGVAEGFPFLSLSDGKDVPRAILSLRDGAPGLVLTDVEGRRRAKLGLLPGGEPALSLFDEDQERPRTFLGSSMLSLADKRGQGRLFLGADDEPVLVLSSEQEHALLELGREQDGSILRVRDRNGTVRIALNALSGATRLLVYDTKGEIVWSRP